MRCSKVGFIIWTDRFRCQRAYVAGHSDGRPRGRPGVTRSIEPALARVSERSHRLDARVRNELVLQRLPPLSMLTAAGRGGQVAFVRKSGAPLTQGIDGAYTRASCKS
ncbi:ImcF-related family protein [Burkholderia sp. AW49-1]